MPEPGARRTLHPFGSGRELDDMVRSLFALALASRRTQRFFIYSPWITDLVVLDNSFGQLRGLVPDDATRKVRLVGYLSALHERGVDVRVVTQPARPDDRLQIVEFVDRFCDEIDPGRLRRCERLHAKRIVTELFTINGSMNLTHQGVHINREEVLVTTEREAVNEAMHGFLHLWRELEGTS